MFLQGSTLQRLLDAPVRPGRVVWIGVRPARRTAPTPTESVMLDPTGGVDGDHARSPRRQVTLIGAEDLAAIAAFLGRDQVEPAALRRNIVVAGINLHALKEAGVRIGAAELLVTGACHPCSRMEEVFGTGGYNAVRGHGGVTARIVRAGRVAVGDAVSRVPQPAPARASPDPGS